MAQVLCHQRRERGVRRAGKIVQPIAERVVDAKGRQISSGIVGFARGEGECESVVGRGVERDPSVSAGETRTASAFRRVLPVGAVHVGPGLEYFVPGEAIGGGHGHVVSAESSVNVGYIHTRMGSERKQNKTYGAKREERTTLFPFCQATVNGLLVMRPPQATPTHPTSTGAATWMTTSKADLTVTELGTATRYEMLRPSR